MLPAPPEASRSSPKATSAHLWCLPLQKYSRREVQSEIHTDKWGGEALGRSECLILARFSENFLYRREAQLQKGTTSPSQCKEPECQRLKMNFPKMASCNDGRRALKYPKGQHNSEFSKSLDEPLWTQGSWF